MACRLGVCNVKSTRAMWTAARRDRYSVTSRDKQSHVAAQSPRWFPGSFKMSCGTCLAASGYKRCYGHCCLSMHRCVTTLLLCTRRTMKYVSDAIMGCDLYEVLKDSSSLLPDRMRVRPPTLAASRKGKGRVADLDARLYTPS